MIKLSFSTLGNPKLPLEQFAALLRTAGYEAIELRGRPGEHVHWQDSPARRNEVKKILADAGLEVAAISSYVFLANRDSGGPARCDTRDEPENLAELQRWVELAGDLGARHVRVFGGALSSGETHAEALPRVARIMDAAAKVNPAVGIALEAHDVWNTGRLISDVLDATTQPNCKCLWDICGPAEAGEKAEKFFKAVRPERIAYLHLKDWFPMPGEKEPYLCLLGAGVLPLKKIVYFLKKADWSGYLDVEWEGVYHAYMPPLEVAVAQGALKLRELLGK